MRKRAKIFAVTLLAVIAFALAAVYVSARESTDSVNYEGIYQSMKGMSFDEMKKRGDDFFFRQELDSAMVCFTFIAGSYDGKCSPEERRLYAETFNKLGHLSILQSNYLQAYSYFLKAVNTGDKHEGNKAKIYISVIYSYYDDYAEVMRYLNEAYAYAIKEHDYTDLLTIHHNLTNIAFKYDQLLSCSDILYDFPNIKGIPDSPLYRYELYINEAMICIVHKDYKDAIRKFAGAMKEVEGPDELTPYVISAYENIGKCHALAGNYAKALENTQAAIDLARKYGITEAMVQDIKLMADYYKQMGDNDNAAKHKLQYMEMHDSIFSTQNFKQIRNLETSYQIGQIQEQLAKTISEKRTYSVVAKIMAVVTVFVIVFLVIIMRQNSTIRQAYKDLFMKNMELMRQGKSATAEKRGTTASEAPKGNEGIGGVQQTAIFDAVCHVMESSDKVYSPDFSIEQLSELVGYNSKYVSKAINDIAGKNFRTFLSEYRIREAQRRLADHENFSSFTNETIGEQVGFRSRSSFIATFKKITGLTPKEYQRQMRIHRQEAEA